jgi:hypothetical protein
MPLVERTRPNVMHVHTPGVADDTGMVTTGRITLVPGINTLTDEQYAACQKNKGFNGAMSTGALRLVTPSSAKPAPKTKSGNQGSNQGGGSGAAEIANMTVTDAKAIIAQVNKIEDLEAIKEADSRKGIQEACDAQIEELKKLDDKE